MVKYGYAKKAAKVIRKILLGCGFFQSGYSETQDIDYKTLSRQGKNKRC